MTTAGIGSRMALGNAQAGSSNALSYRSSASVSAPNGSSRHGATVSHMEIGVRELRNRTAQVIDAVKAGERVVLTVNGEPTADIVPHGQRTRWLSGEWLQAQLTTGAADPELAVELDDLVGQTLDEL